MKFLRVRSTLIFGAIAGMSFGLPASVNSFPYSPNQVEVDAINLGLTEGDVAFGDFDLDGDLDILANGLSGGNNRQLRVYRNNGNGTFDPAQIEVDGVNGGLDQGGVDWGDFDGDGDLDILCNGRSSGGGTNRQLRVYRNNGNGTFNAAQIEVDGANNGLILGDVKWGDFNNDGDLDILAAGVDATGNQIRVYRNNGNGTFDPNQIEVDGLNGGLRDGVVDWGDFDGDGDLDILAQGWAGAAVSEIRVYRNNGNGTFDPNQINIDAAEACDGYNGHNTADWGDYDNDGDLDILVSGVVGTDTANSRLRIYRNNGNGTFNDTQVEVNGATGGHARSGSQFADLDNDGDLDIVANGDTTGAGTIPELRAYINTGGVFTANELEPTAGDELYLGSLDLRDYDADGDVDIAVLGQTTAGAYQLRVYRSSAALTNPNLPPNPPTILATSFAFSPTATSTATFMWNAGTDNNPGATPETGLSYGLQIATVTTFASLVYQGDVSPPKTYDGGTKYGKILTSTSPWNPGGGNYGLRTDTTYYHRVQTIDAGLARSAYTLITVATSTLWTGVGPATSTLAAVAGILPGDIRISWNAAGDDAVYNNLTGSYRVQYASSPAVAWSTATTPAGAFTLTVATTNIVPGTAQSRTINVPTNDTWYFVLWSRDDVGEWSLISNTISALPALINRSVTIDAGTPYNFGSQTVGTSSASATAVLIRNDGNVATTYALSAATTTAGGSPWSIGSGAGSDTLVVFGAFHGTRPVVANFGPEDALSTLTVPSGAAIFSINGTQTGAAVAVGATRNLWLRLDTPTLSSTEAPQQITVTITAGP